MNCYVDSSVVLRYLLGGDRALERIVQFERSGCSELLGIECARVCARYRLEGSIDDAQLAESMEILDELLAGMHVLELSGAIKTRAAAAFPTVIGTLDALHLSSALLWRDSLGAEGVSLFTFDAQMAVCARAMGLPVL